MVEVIEICSLEMLDMTNTSKKAVFVLQMFRSVDVLLMMRTGVSDSFYLKVPERSQGLLNNLS
jgi:hypothetical protein